MKKTRNKTKSQNLTPNELLTRPPKLLAQGKAVNNSYMLKKTKSYKYHIFYIIMIKSPRNFVTIKSSLCNNRSDH